MKIDREFKTLLIKLLFCNDNFSYKAYTGALCKTKTVKNIIVHTLDKLNFYKGINLTLDDDLSFSTSNDDKEILDIYITIANTDIDFDQIMIPIKLIDINNGIDSALLFPSDNDEEIKLNLRITG